MSAYNRYSFTKGVYPDYVVLLVRKNKYYSYGCDKRLLEYIKFKDKTYILKKKHINYLVHDELDIVEKYEYEDNMLDKYVYLMYIKRVFDNLKSYKYDLL